MKAGDITSDFSTEISKRVRAELTGEGAMAARLATKIKHALEVSTHMKSSVRGICWRLIVSFPSV